MHSMLICYMSILLASHFFLGVTECLQFVHIFLLINCVIGENQCFPDRSQGVLNTIETPTSALIKTGSPDHFRAKLFGQLFHARSDAADLLESCCLVHGDVSVVSSVLKPGLFRILADSVFDSREKHCQTVSFVGWRCSAAVVPPGH